MQLVYFETTRRDHALDDVHQGVVTDMRRLAESIDGFVRWRDVDDGLDYWGVVMFETEDAAIAWRDHPDHVAIHARSRGELYVAFSTMAFERVRTNRFDGG
jgi:heme-degrading monooxygenase HmoA